MDAVIDAWGQGTLLRALAADGVPRSARLAAVRQRCPGVCVDPETTAFALARRVGDWAGADPGRWRCVEAAAIAACAALPDEQARATWTERVRLAALPDPARPALTEQWVREALASANPDPATRRLLLDVVALRVPADEGAPDPDSPRFREELVAWYAADPRGRADGLADALDALGPLVRDPVAAVRLVAVVEHLRERVARYGDVAAQPRVLPSLRAWLARRLGRDRRPRQAPDRGASAADRLFERREVR